MPSSSQPDVAILLGTCDGERFLARQLDSIHAQTYRGWILCASDDGSRDATVSILESYRAKWGRDKLAIVAGPARGFRANFLSLACDPSIEAKYFAFCDQDDLWDADKLATALAWLDAVPAQVPALYCARTRLIDEFDAVTGLSPLFPKPPIFENAIVQSIAGGNTMVFNRAARALLVEAGADVIVQTHDWWTYILVTACGGRVFYDVVPKVGYRQHTRNMVGSNKTWAGRFTRLRRIMIGHFRTMNGQNIAALQRVRQRLSPSCSAVLGEFSRARDGALIPRILGIRRAGVYCQTLLLNLVLLFATILKKL